MRILALEAFEEILRSARPRLIVRSECVKDRVRLEHFIREFDLGWDEVTSEGYDATHSPLGPVYWRIVTRGSERLYLSTFLATPAVVIKVWGRKGLTYRNTDTGLTAARVETLLLPRIAVAGSRQGDQRVHDGPSTT